MMPPNRPTRGWGWLALISIIVIGMVIPIERAEAHRIDINFSRPFEVSAEGSLSQISESVPITNRSNIVQTDSPHLEFFEFLSAQNSAIGYRASSGQSGFYFSKPEVINRMVGVVIGRPLGEMIPRKQNQRSKVYEINEGVSTSNVHNIQGDSERLIPNVVSGGLPVWRSKPDMFESKFWSVRRKKFIAGKSELVFSSNSLRVDIWSPTVASHRPIVEIARTTVKAATTTLSLSPVLRNSALLLLRISIPVKKVAQFSWLLLVADS